MTIAIIGLSMTTMAQNQDDNKNRPKKPDPPQIVAPDKDKPKDRPKDDNNTNRPKKPESAILVGGNQTEITMV